MLRPRLLAPKGPPPVLGPEGPSWSNVHWSARNTPLPCRRRGGRARPKDNPKGHPGPGGPHTNADPAWSSYSQPQASTRSRTASVTTSSESEGSSTAAASSVAVSAGATTVLVGASSSHPSCTWLSTPASSSSATNALNSSWSQSLSPPTNSPSYSPSPLSSLTAASRTGTRRSPPRDGLHPPRARSRPENPRPSLSWVVLRTLRLRSEPRGPARETPYCTMACLWWLRRCSPPQMKPPFGSL